MPPKSRRVLLEEVSADAQATTRQIINLSSTDLRECPQAFQDFIDGKNSASELSKKERRMLLNHAMSKKVLRRHMNHLVAVNFGKGF